MAEPVEADASERAKTERKRQRTVATLEPRQLIPPHSQHEEESALLRTTAEYVVSFS